jgi:3-oxoacyl-[acyl-carrier-protein] synthase II
MRRVVVTGLGVVSPLGRGVKHNWESLIAGKSGIRPTQGMDLKDIPVTISGQVPFGENEPDFNPDTVIAPKDQKKNDKTSGHGHQIPMADGQCMGGTHFCPVDE